MLVLYFALLYGILTLAGGIFGYLKAGSTASLISGLVSGLLILASATALWKGKLFGYYGLFGLAILLGIFFGIRFFKAWAFMPAGLMLVLSALMLVALLVQKPHFLQSS